ncbi:hypothetical protein L1987_58289 [Smallanthus sonchifolius]|uniref:Uncharacterized protein n=1 Tax=Smallanthus sonchifolius TaxID=185202 RepID=A0ACB9DFB9_9ASTR|nr:hypothetical protein L1987_58289 [Smallanthus sonchifolius]
MDRFDLDRRSLESKQGWRSISLPPLPLVAVSAIVVFLLSFSQYSNLKSWSSNVGLYLQLFLFFTPVILVFFLSSSSIAHGWWFSFGSRKRNRTMNLDRVSDPYGD